MNIHSVSLHFSKTLFSVTLLSFILFGPAANAKEQISISWHMLYLCMRRQNILWFRQGMQKNHKMIQKFKSIIHDDDDLTIYSYTFFGFLLESSGRWIEKLLLLFHWYNKCAMNTGEILTRTSAYVRDFSSIEFPIWLYLLVVKQKLFLEIIENS